MIEHVIEGCPCLGKACSKCKEAKCYEAYHIDKREKDGRTSACKKCINARRKSKRLENIENVRAYHRAYRRAHAKQQNEKNRTKYREDVEAKAKKAAYYQKHVERIKLLRKEHQKRHSQQIQKYKKARYQKFAESFKEQKKDYYREKAEIIRKRRKERRKAHPSLYINIDKAHTARRRALKIQAEGRFSVQEWAELKAKYNFSCLCCGRSEPDIRLTVDHVVPLVKGGTNYIDNIQPLCFSCNSRKHSKTIDYRGEKRWITPSTQENI